MLQMRRRRRHRLPREDPRGDVGEEIKPHFTTPTSSRGFLRGCRRVGRVDEDPREKVGVGVGVVECELYWTAVTLML